MTNLVATFCLLVTLFGCAVTRPSAKQSLMASNLQDNIIVLEPDLRRFESRGPFSVMSRLDREFNLDLEQRVVVDHFFAKSKDKLPIIIISHGNFSNKRAHRSQAKHLASWGFHVITVESPNRDEWLENGRRLKRIADMFYGFPRMLGDNADARRIIMAGHSFGGSATILAIAGGAPAIGAVLLDPAVVNPDVVDAMKKSDVPVALLGSDQRVFTARGRHRFLKNISGEMLEISVPLSTHDDAQGPSVFSQAALGVDPFTSDNNQDLFRSMFTVAVMGMSSSGTLDFSVKVFAKASKVGVLSDLKYRSSKLDR